MKVFKFKGMILYTDKTKQDFVPIELCKKMKEVGVPMKDAKYFICGPIDSTPGRYGIFSLEELSVSSIRYPEEYPTYTLTELLYKLPEWHPEYKALKLMWKDAPFYWAQFEQAPDASPFCCYSEYPIVSAAWLLINCVKEGFGCVTDISGKL